MKVLSGRLKGASEIWGISGHAQEFLSYLAQTALKLTKFVGIHEGSGCPTTCHRPQYTRCSRTFDPEVYGNGTNRIEKFGRFSVISRKFCLRLKLHQNRSKLPEFTTTTVLSVDLSSTTMRSESSRFPPEEGKNETKSQTLHWTTTIEIVKIPRQSLSVSSTWTA